RAAYPHLRASPQGVVVAISSIGAHIGMPHRLTYSVAKGALEAMIRVLAVEWAPDGIRVVGVAPGWVMTPFVRRIVEEGHLEVARLEERIPMDRLGEPGEIAATIAY